MAHVVVANGVVVVYIVLLQFAVLDAAAAPETAGRALWGDLDGSGAGRGSQGGGQ